MWSYKAALFSLIVGKLSYIRTLDEKDWLFRQKCASGVKNIQLTLSWKYLKSFHFPFLSRLSIMKRMAIVADIFAPSFRNQQ